MKILCVVNDKNGYKPPAIYVLKTDNLSLNELRNIVNVLSLKPRLNPELVYYATRIDERKIKYTNEQIVSLFKKIGDDNEIFERI